MNRTHRQQRRRLWAGARLLVALLALAACRPADTAPGDGTPQTSGVGGIVTRIVEQITFVTSTPDPAQPAAPQEPVVLDISLSGELPDLDPGRAESDAQLDLAQNLFAGLTNFNPDTNTIEPELAKSWETDATGRTWTFNLRDDIFWLRAGNPLPGREEAIAAEPVRPVTADDVVFAIQRLCSREVDTALAFTLFLIDGCERVFTTLEPTEADRNSIAIRAVDPVTLAITLTRPAGYFLTLTSMPLFQPVPRELVDELGNEWRNAIGDFSTGWQTPENLVTSGPYLVAPLTITSQSMKLHRNPLWPLESPGNVDSISVSFLEDEQDGYEMWQDRFLDIAPLPAAERDALAARTPEKMRVIPDEVLFYLGFNFDSQVFREAEVRRAFSAAIDRQRIIDELYDGSGLVMRHATVPGVVATIPVDEVGVGYSPDYAAEQMAASTFRSCRLMPTITLRVSSADLSLRQAEMMRDMWVEELGCEQENINIEQVQFGALLAGTRPDATGRPDMWELAWAPTFPDAHNLLGDLLQCQDSENRQNRPCSEADTLLQRAATAVDPAERAALYRQAEALFFSETGLFPIAPLYIRARAWVVHDWVAFTPIAFGGQQWDRITLDATLKELERSR
jgi:oligopeptide transport system substrate-binding protein